MYMFTWLLILLAVTVYWAEAAVTSETCQVKPPEKHCMIESVVKDRWPHKERWVFDWRRQECNVVYWANHCAEPLPDTNNFASKEKCVRECSGWA